MKYKKIHFIILFILTFLVYFNSLKNDFTFDDKEIIQENFYFKNIPAYKWLLNNNYFSYSREFSYRPIITLSYLIDFYIFKLKPFGYHLTNLLLHLFVIIIIYLFLCEITKEPDVAFLASLLFSIHTINTEAVDSIGFREDILCTLFYIIAFYFYIIYSQRNQLVHLIISLGGFLLALFSKEMALSFPIMIFIYDVFFKKESMKFETLVKKYIPVLGIVAIYIFIRFWYLKNPTEYIPVHPEEFSLKRFFLIPEVFCRYLFLLFSPIRLSVTHTYLISDYKFHITLIPYIIILVSIVYLALYLKRYNTFLSFGLIFFLISLLPVINIIPIGHLMAERFLYLPNIGFCFFLTNLILLLKNSNLRKIIFFIFLVFFSLLTYNRNKVWRDEESLWKATIKASPNSYRAHNGLGLVYYNAGEYDKAVEEFTKTISLEPFYGNAYINLGLTYSEKKEIDKALLALVQGLQINPENASFYMNLGIIYAKENMTLKALEYFKKSAEMEPLNPTTYNNIGLVYGNMGLNKEAMEMFKKSVALDPDYSEAHFNLGTAYALNKNYIEAIKEYEITLRLDPMRSLAVKQLELAKQKLKELN